MLKLSDFGIARLFGNANVSREWAACWGRRNSWPPSKPRAGTVDPRSDLYSLGGVLYVLLARRPLYSARSFAEMLDKQRFEKPAPLRHVAADVPAELEQIIHRLLEKDPDRRFGTATVLERRLETMLETFTRVAARRCPGKSRSNRRRPLCRRESIRRRLTRWPRPLRRRRPRERSRPAAVPPWRALAPSPPEPVENRPPRTSGRFVPVRPGELDPASPERPAEAWISPQTWALVVGLLAVWLLAWYMLQPPSADGLYRRIQRQTEGESGALRRPRTIYAQFLDPFSRRSPQ